MSTLHEAIATDNRYEEAFQAMQAIQREVSNEVYMPQDDLRIVIATAMVGEHVLFKGSPGTGKTSLAKAMATAIGGTFKRVQGTSETMPADIHGGHTYNFGTQKYDFEPGPVFSNILVIDEGNRMPLKTQSALLEPMEERTVTLRGETRSLPDPFLVLETENLLGAGEGNPMIKPILDRFSTSVHVQPFNKEDMLAIIALKKSGYKAQQALTPATVRQARETTELVGTGFDVENQTTELVVALRKHKDLDKETIVLDGVRPALDILKIARAVALSDRRQNVATKDIALAARYVLPHRVGLSFEAEGRGKATQEIVQEVIDSTL